MCRIDYSSTVKKILTSLMGKLRTEFTSLTTKCTSPGLSDTTFFARCNFEIDIKLFITINHTFKHLHVQVTIYVLTEGLQIEVLNKRNNQILLQF